jgi:hypothetical protein
MSVRVRACACVRPGNVICHGVTVYVRSSVRACVAAFVRDYLRTDRAQAVTLLPKG